MEEMYTEIILDYYRNPRNNGTIDSPDSISHDVNPLCGDEITIHLKIKEDKIEDIKFSGKGCAISQASVSMLTETVKGKTLEKIKNLNREDVLEMIQIPISAARLKCVMLGLKVFKVALYNYMGQKMSEDEEKNLD